MTIPHDSTFHVLHKCFVYNLCFYDYNLSCVVSNCGFSLDGIDTKIMWIIMALNCRMIYVQMLLSNFNFIFEINFIIKKKTFCHFIQLYLPRKTSKHLLRSFLPVGLYQWITTCWTHKGSFWNFLSKSFTTFFYRKILRI